MTTLMVTLGFLGAKSYPELLSAAFFAPLGLYFGILVLPKKSKATAMVKTKSRPEGLTKIKPIEGEVEGEFDQERRKFLRIIGSAGASLFFLSIFTKKAQAAFFGSVPGPGTVALKDKAGAQIDPAVKQPTDGYKIAKIDDAGAVSYFGFLDKEGKWFIQKEDAGDYQYASGDSGFSTSWGIHDTTLEYHPFDEAF